MLPVALAYIMIISTATYALDYAGIHPTDWRFAVAMLVMNLVLMGILVGFIDRGRLISPAYRRLDKRDMDKLRRAAYDRARFQPATSEGGAD
jgi:NADH-quinone oxidoreductase subunit H